MTKKEQDIIFSEPIREIMEKPPRYLARFGTMGLFGLMVLFIFLSWIIKYPDTIPGKIVLTTENPPANIIAKSAGRIVNVRVAEGSKVKRGEILAGIESSANFYEAEQLISFVDQTGFRSGCRFDNVAGTFESWRYAGIIFSAEKSYQ